MDRQLSKRDTASWKHVVPEKRRAEALGIWHTPSAVFGKDVASIFYGIGSNRDFVGQHGALGNHLQCKVWVRRSDFKNFDFIVPRALRTSVRHGLYKLR